MDAFAQRTALVTGGASGIGRELCRELGRRGALVVVADLDADGARRVADEIGAAGGRAEAVPLDVTDGEAVRRALEETAAKRGRLDFVFNNAGIAIIGDTRDMTLERWRRTVDVDLWGVVHGSRAAFEIMARQGSGHIVNTSSLAGLVAAPMEIPYTAAKHAVVGLSRALRVEGVDLGVRVTVVCPGLVDTPILRRSEAVGGGPDDLALDGMPAPFDAAKAARVILRGVERNREVVVFPAHAHALVWLDRLAPVLSRQVWLRFTRELRRRLRPADRARPS